MCYSLKNGRSHYKNSFVACHHQRMKQVCTLSPTRYLPTRRLSSIASQEKKCVYRIPSETSHVYDQSIQWLSHEIAYHRTSIYWITSGEKTSVYRGTLGSRRSVLCRNEILKEQFSFCRHYLSSLVLVDLLGSANCEIKIQIVAIQY